MARPARPRKGDSAFIPGTNMDINAGMLFS
jgi:hypothetical protein